ncbi:MAG: NAD(P)H-hydrate dehydratase [Bryobacteraceae bacterium]|nr:NAD(P)H-hydrate dehydratase [Bryobacteraceae bacterium]
MKVLTAAQMRDIDLRTMELGIPGIVLMENAGHRVVEFLDEKFAPLAAQRIVVLCGKGNNGGDGFVVARQLHTRFRPQALHVVFAGNPDELKAEAAENFRMLEACRCPVTRALTPEMRLATIVIDALLGTGLTGPVRGPMLDLIREINTGFPLARIVAVDMPSGLPSDSAEVSGEAVRAHYTVTFTAPKISHVLPPACGYVGELRVGAIGSDPRLFEDDDSIDLALSGAERFRRLFGPRAPESHKGSFGHVLVIGGSRGKSGAAAMAGLSALRAGAGLVTVASAAGSTAEIASHAAELMTEPLPETDAGTIAAQAFDYGRFAALAERKTVFAVGPGLGAHAETITFVRRLVADYSQPMVIDADGLNALAGADFTGRPSMVLTPHPGEMSRLAGLNAERIAGDRVRVARTYATERNVCLVLKGYRSLVAMPGGRVWVNPTGTPGMATGGTGDILTGMIAGLMAQFPEDQEAAVLAAVYLHGLAGQIGVRSVGEKSLIATDLLRRLPEAIGECAGVPDQL